MHSHYRRERFENSDVIKRFDQSEVYNEHHDNTAARIVLGVIILQDYVSDVAKDITKVQVVRHHFKVS